MKTPGRRRSPSSGHALSGAHLAQAAEFFAERLNRIGEQSAAGREYYLPDALGSVRQLADVSATVTLAKGYKPYGEILASAGTGTSAYGFAGEWRDTNGLIYLRARYYSVTQGRFISADSWKGDYRRPLSLNAWLYVLGNPVNYTDTTGRSPSAVVPPWPPICWFGVDPQTGTCKNPLGLPPLLVAIATQSSAQSFGTPETTIAAGGIIFLGLCLYALSNAFKDVIQGRPVTWVETNPQPNPKPTIVVPLFPQLTSTPEPEYIYRIVSRESPKELSIHAESTYKTGLSFYDFEPYGGRYWKFNVSVLKSGGYEVRFDGNQPAVELDFWGGGPYISPHTGRQETFPPGHVTVYHPDFGYWKAWHEEDLNTYGQQGKFSQQAERLYNLRER